MKKSTAILIIIFSLSTGAFVAKTETAVSEFFTSGFVMTGFYFIVKLLEEKL